MEKETSESQKNLKYNIKKKILVLSGKGGVGKSTVSTNIAVGLSLKKLKVGLLDIDIHGPNIPSLLGLDSARPGTTEEGLLPVSFSENLKVMSIGFFLPDQNQAVIWRGPLKHRAIQQFLTDVVWGNLDYLVVDSPPGTGDEIISITHLLEKPDGAIIVATPQKVALSDVRKSITFCREINVPILGIVENMSGFVCPKCGEVVDVFKSGGAEKLAKEFGIPFLGKIPLDPQIVQTGDAGKPIILYYPESAPAKAFENIVEKIREQLGV